MQPLKRLPDDTHRLVRTKFYDEIWVNNKYEVLVRRNIMPGDKYGPPEGVDFPPITWLSIKRRGNREAIRDWRHLQEIKNDICGANAEGVELYPSEGRKMDTSNQFHLWVLEEGNGFPFGQPFRTVCDVDEAKIDGATQRTFRSSDRYCDCTDPSVFAKAREAEKKAGGMLDPERQQEPKSVEETKTDAVGALLGVLKGAHKNNAK